MKTYISTVSKRWEDLKKALYNDEKYKDYSVFRIDPIILTINNNVYASSNILGSMSILIEFDNQTLDGFNYQKVAGVDISTKKVESINPDKTYISIEKERECEEELFIAFSISVVQELSTKKSDVESVNAILNVLEKYSSMFSKKETKLPKHIEQGLYCELSYLESIIDRFGDETVLNWVGPEANKHDFIFDDYAVEVKSTSNQEQTIIKISNENQLDKFDLKNLFLKVYVMETNPRGEYLHDIIKRICSKISNSEMYSRFLTCLLLEGIEPLIYKGKYCFKVVRDIDYEVDEKFPKIIRNNIPTEAFEVEYKLNLSNVNELDG